MIVTTLGDVLPFFSVCHESTSCVDKNVLCFVVKV